jgi:membrane fusion protein
MAVLVWVLGILVTGLLVVLFTIRYKETVPARGVLESISPPLELVSPTSARVVDVFVSEGQKVASGEVLAVLSKEVLNGSGRTPEHLSIEQLTLKLSLIEKERILAKKIVLTKTKQLRSGIGLLESKLHNLNQSELFSSERLAVSSNNLNAFSKLLETSNVSRLQHNQQQLNFLEAAQYANSIEFEKLATEAKLAQQRLEVSAIELEFLTVKADFDQQSRQYRSEIDSLKSNHLIRIVSSSTGLVTGLVIKKGMAVRPNQYLMQVNAPENALVATLYVSSQIIGKLHTEQAMRLSFDTFPVNEYGYYNANIVEIGGTPLDPRATSLPVQSPNQSVFKVVASLQKNYVEGPDIYPLKSGYEFTAHFITEDLSLLQFVLQPLLSLRAKSQ